MQVVVSFQLPCDEKAGADLKRAGRGGGGGVRGVPPSRLRTEKYYFNGNYKG